MVLRSTPSFSTTTFSSESQYTEAVVTSEKKPCIIASKQNGQRLAAVVEHGAGEVHLDGEDVRLLQHGVALVVVVGHAGDEALQLEHNVLDWRGGRGAGKERMICVITFRDG
ncbi:hypothetical protein EYF80_034130 [Liparis tanakae]|uniref:Uncharacterized protein n=1 Tax=Liparis tanakae TaxID=230148 RepID=A0A4Z2GSM1_9TELE|nr:hypothetical protein EYF80_034130 [Liparis tanakae]